MTTKYNVLFITPKLGGDILYHTDIIKTFDKLCNTFFYGPGYKYYNVSDGINAIIKKSNMDIDFIVFGTAMVLYNLHINGLAKIDIPKVIFLNKEYQMLDKKLTYIKNNKFSLVSTILNNKEYKVWEKKINIPFIQIPHGIFCEEFKCLGIPKQYDFGFLGALFKNLGVAWRIKAKQFIFESTDLYKNYNILWGDDTNNGFVYGEQYIKILNSCKMFLSTLSPANIIGLRFYQLASVKTMILCPRDEYDGVFIDKLNCVMYNDSSTDFKNKFEYYLHNGGERIKIVNAAYEEVTKKHSWDMRIKKLISVLMGV